MAHRSATDVAVRRGHDGRDRSWVPPGLAGARSLDLLAGLTLAAMAIPEALGYASLAGMPAVTGLYCMLLPVVAYVVLASSRQIVVGPDSSTAPIVLGAIAPFAAAGSAHFVEMAAMLSILVGILLLVVFVARLSVLADFLSRPVLAGFLSGIGVTVIVSQIPSLLGMDVTSRQSLLRIGEIVRELPSADLWTSIIGAGSVVLIVLLGRLARRLPAQLIAVVVAGLVVWAGSLQQHGVDMVESFSAGLPSLGLPMIGWSETGSLITPALAIVVLIIAQTVATGESFAHKHDYDFRPGREVAALGLSNLAAGFSGTFCVNASATKTEVVDAARGRSQLAALVSVAVVLAVLLAGSDLIAALPMPAVAAVVIVAGVHLIDTRGLRDVLRARPTEFVVATVGGLAVVCFSITWGFVVLVVLAIADRLRIARRPSDAVIGLVPQRGWHDVSKHADAVVPRGFLAYRFSSSLYFPNAGRFHERILEIVRNDGPPRWLVLDAAAIAHIDYTGGMVLKDVCDELRVRGVTFAIAELTDEQKRQLRSLGIVERLGERYLFETMEQAVRAYLNETGMEWTQPESDRSGRPPTAR